MLSNSAWSKNRAQPNSRPNTLLTKFLKRLSGIEEEFTFMKANLDVFSLKRQFDPFKFRGS